MLPVAAADHYPNLKLDSIKRCTQKSLGSCLKLSRGDLSPVSSLKRLLDPPQGGCGRRSQSVLAAVEDYEARAQGGAARKRGSPASGSSRYFEEVFLKGEQVLKD